MLSGLHKFMDYYYNRDDYLSFGGESVKFLLEGIVHFICKTVLLFPPAYLVPT